MAGSTVQHHYESFLAEHYSWMFGDYDAKVRESVEYLRERLPAAQKGAVAIDLGCGSGFQSLALADLGFKVVSVDSSESLLQEVTQRKGARDITPVQDDIVSYMSSREKTAAVIVCMGDTLTHLQSPGKIEQLFGDCHRVLEQEGIFLVSFRDMTAELTGVDRVIPVRTERDKIMTCFLEYEDKSVKVSDILYEWTPKGWRLTKSSYRKLRIGNDWVRGRLEECGFKVVELTTEKGMTSTVVVKTP